MASIITTNSRSIWNFLKSQGLSEYGIAGLMGNLYAESGLNSINLENTGNTKLCMSDEYYTNCVDNGTYNNFINDGYGYGLAQWTWRTRKKALYDYNKSLGLSIGDLNGQLKYLVSELKSSSYIDIYSTLKAAASVREASDIVLVRFECPADTSDKMKELRASYGQEYYDEFSTKTIVNNTMNNSIVNNTASVVTPSTDFKYSTYKVQPGDTLWAIANTFKVTVNDIITINNISITNPDTIYPGQCIIIPNNKADTATDSTASTTITNSNNSGTVSSTNTSILNKVTSFAKKTTNPIFNKFKKLFGKKN